ncbi:MAG: hypothetical protein IBX45_00350 [Campylobacterales bacterium]|nr:hypothetical protein [Campylobacterales bacterium]
MKSTPCLLCKHTHFYLLKDGRLECTACNHRYSPTKRAQTLELLEAFLAQHSPQNTAHTLGISLPTVQKNFAHFRHLCAILCERAYESRAGAFCEYEEYLFLPASKQKNLYQMVEGIGIMGLSTGKHVYTLLMPDHLHTYDAQIRANPEFIHTLSNYYQWHKISKLTTSATPLSRFWVFLEEFLKGFYGVKREHFGAYLKEAEFRFNHDKATQKSLLAQAWREHEARRLRAKMITTQEPPLSQVWKI